MVRLGRITHAGKRQNSFSSPIGSYFATDDDAAAVHPFFIKHVALLLRGRDDEQYCNLSTGGIRSVCAYEHLPNASGYVQASNTLENSFHMDSASSSIDHEGAEGPWLRNGVDQPRIVNQ